ncbi:MAG: spore coat protein CotJB [Ruminococcaceae bacterium]|nr:spore coat protein CotJB [Oscillospiraceae bacterium]
MMNNHKNMTSQLAKSIQKIDFALAETILYLDVYPHSKEALNYYHKLLSAREKLIEQYQAHSPITAAGNTSTESWDWIKSPWPWHYDAN